MAAVGGEGRRVGGGQRWVAAMVGDEGHRVGEAGGGGRVRESGMGGAGEELMLVGFFVGS